MRAPPPPKKDATLYVLPMVPLPAIGSAQGFLLHKKLHAYRQPAGYQWEPWEILKICDELTIPVPRRVELAMALDIPPELGAPANPEVHSVPYGDRARELGRQLAWVAKRARAALAALEREMRSRR